MAEVLKSGGAIDARFQLVDQSLAGINKDIGRLENKVNYLEENQDKHHDGLTKHDNAIDTLNKTLGKLDTTFEKSLCSVNQTLEEFKTIKQKAEGAIWLFKFVLAPSGALAAAVYIVQQVVQLVVK